jgi:DNA-binding response OmpR family regulator
VLIVDPSAETREVLRTALEGDRTHVLEAHRADRGLEMVRQHRPNLVVLDLEIDGSSADTLAADFDAEIENDDTPLLMLGSARRMRQLRPGWQFVDKPYHYGPLIRKIEALLEGAAEPPLRRCA